MSPGKYNFTFLFFYAVLSVLLFSCQKQKRTYFESIALNDIKLSASPKPGSWRYNHDENFQTFEDFKKSKKIKPTRGKNTIYLQPIGKFDDLQKKEIALTKEYLKYISSWKQRYFLFYLTAFSLKRLKEFQKKGRNKFWQAMYWTVF